MKKIFALAACLPLMLFAQAQPPELASWLINTTGATGYNGIHANVDSVQYSTSNVYVRCSGVPEYTIGPWPDGNPNVPANQHYLFRIPRLPQANTGALTNTPLGHIGAWRNGVPVYNPLDARSYNNQNIWHQNAVVVEARGFDICYGHPAQRGRYHHHQNPRCLYSDDSTKHSPLLGYAFDGFPIYGPRGYANANGGVKRMRSGYRLRNLTQRHTLPNGSVLAANQYGPEVSAIYPLGYYAEDFEYVAALGDLDEHNGRFAITPEYPQGTYAYYTTIDEGGASAYPYVIGPQYYGAVATDNFGNGQVTINEPVQTYPASGTTSVVSEQSSVISYQLRQNYPNPFSPQRQGTFGYPSTVISFQLPVSSRVTLKVFDVNGREVATLVEGEMSAGSHAVPFTPQDLAGGIYFYKLTAGKFSQTRKALLLQ